MERKLATVLFVDLVGSTSFVSTSDPEVVRRRVTRFFDGVSHCIVSHGGIVEKFAGDAVMAAFGIPQAHEDDAERAVRAALAIIDSVGQLGLEARVGIESGEVVADDTESTFATGEAVNVAARLQQAAEPGEILMGPTASRLTQGRVETEARTIELRGLREPITVCKVLGVPEEPGRAVTVTGPFVGRDAELELLENTFERAVRDERAHLFTIYGEPGVGKSRVAREFLAGVEGATILAGRCLPYGEGITYWPLAEMVKIAAGISDDDPVQEAVGKLRAACGDDAVADLLGLAAGVLDLVEGERSGQEIAWAAREWATELADAQPLILVFEDIHWAEEPLLELVEHLAERVREAPMLIICLARTELLDVRPGWGGGRLRATSIELERLAPSESEELVLALLEDTELPEPVRRALLDKTEGNPLFVEETIRMLVEQAPDETAGERIPDTIQALIAARIDRLPRDSKAVLQRAAAIGRIFWEGAIASLSPDVDSIDAVLDDLLLRDFVIRESRSTISGEQAFRFKHVLIRDVAYGGLSKGARAELHADFAGWLHDRAAEELIEIRAYHLDQAATLHEELDGHVPAELAAEAASALEGAGRRALQREANRSARKLLRRSLELEPTLGRRFWAARAAWRLDDLPSVSSEMELVRTEAAAVGDHELEGRALTALADVALLRDADLPRGRELVEQALELLDDGGGVARFEALTMRARIDWWLGDLESDERHTRMALAVAQEIGSPAHEAESIEELAHIALSRLDVEGAAELAERAMELAEESGNRMTRAWALVSLGRVERTRNELERAETLFAEAQQLFEETGSAWALGRTLEGSAWVAIRAGDLVTGERRLRDAIRILTPIEDRGALCEAQRSLAELLVGRGELDEAERWALEARRPVGPHDQVSRATTRLALGLVRAAQGLDEEAESLFRQGLEIARATGSTIVTLDALRKVALYYRERGRTAEAEAYELEAAALGPAAEPVKTAPIA